ncbi:putative rna methyltransferase [Quercus suber]|uniref:Rna methyltransferase n=1 Tax=Quercus suber TaxID=58331 RepID=A0AAW0KHB3_QUESU
MNQYLAALERSPSDDCHVHAIQKTPLFMPERLLDLSIEAENLASACCHIGIEAWAAKRGNETEKGDEYTKKEAEKERGDEIKKLQETILQTQNLGRTEKPRDVEKGKEKKKTLTIQWRQSSYRQSSPSLARLRPSDCRNRHQQRLQKSLKILILVWAKSKANGKRDGYLNLCQSDCSSFRELFLRILTEGKKCSLGVQLIVDECIQKLNHYCTVDDVQLRSNPRNASYIHICSLLSNLGLL